MRKISFSLGCSSVIHSLEIGFGPGQFSLYKNDMHTVCMKFKMMYSYEVSLKSTRHMQVSDAFQTWFRTNRVHDPGSKEWGHSL